MKCHACDSVATVQWQRHATDGETALYMQGMNEALAARMHYERAMAQLNIAQLGDQRQQLLAMNTHDANMAAAMLAGQIEGHQADLDQAGPVTPPDLSHHLPVTFAVFACDDHALSEDERTKIQPASQEAS